MNNDKSIKQIKKYLGMIQCTRLLCNTKEELGQLLDYPSITKGNGLSGMGGKSLFKQKCVLMGIGEIVRERTGMDLCLLLDTYREAYSIVQNHIPPRFRDAETCQHLIEHFCAQGEITRDIADVVDHVEPRHLPLLVLVLLDVLPSPNTRSGDVTDIEECYTRVMNMLIKSVGKGIVIDTLPAITYAQEVWQDGEDVKNRLFLIHMTDTIIDAYRSVGTRKALGHTNQEILENLFFPDVEGFWTECDEAGQQQPGQVFWRFENLANCHMLYRYSVDDEKRQLTYTKYAVRFIHDEDIDMAYIAHPHSIRYLLTGQPMPNSVVAYLDATIKDDSITFEARSETDKWFPATKLIRSDQPKQLKKLLSSKKYTQVNEFVQDEYSFNLTMVAITRDYIYILNRDELLYRVPKALDEMLEQVGFDHSVGVIEFGDAKFIAFDDFPLYYEVTTPEQMAELGIELTDAVDE